jgi:hypothetical protein
MRKSITIAMAITMMSLFALMFWQNGMDVNAEGAAGSRRQPDYAVSSNPYLPIRGLQPAW